MDQETGVTKSEGWDRMGSLMSGSPIPPNAQQQGSDMSIYQKDEIRSGLFMTKDCSTAIFQPQEPVASLSDIAKRLARLKQKLEVVTQVMADQRRTRH